MTTQIARGQCIDDFYRVRGRGPVFGMEPARREEKHHHEQAHVPQRGNQNRYKIARPPGGLSTVIGRACHRYVGLQKDPTWLLSTAA